MSNATEPAKQYAPFQYGNPKVDAAFKPMTPRNSAPGLVVWLLLVTNPDFLNDLSQGGVGGLRVRDIAEATNLTEEGVRRILRKFTEGGPLQEHFRQVAYAFQSLEATSYPHGNCPDLKAICDLAEKGALVDPDAMF